MQNITLCLSTISTSSLFKKKDESKDYCSTHYFKMAPEDSKSPFMRIPWTASLINRPNIVFHVPGSRKQKSSGEDSLFAEILKTPRTIRSCIAFHQKPSTGQEKIEEVSILMTIGNGLNGHPDTLHGGLISSIIDEGMGILQMANAERDHIAAVGKGHAEGELPPSGYGWYTAELKIRFLKPVLTPAPLVCVAKYTKREGRKEWIYAEIKQRVGASEDYDGDEVVCATGEGLFIQAKPKPNKL